MPLTKIMEKNGKINATIGYSQATFNQNLDLQR